MLIEHRRYYRVDATATFLGRGVTTDFEYKKDAEKYVNEKLNEFITKTIEKYGGNREEYIKTLLHRGFKCFSKGCYRVCIIDDPNSHWFIMVDFSEYDCPINCDRTGSSVCNKGLCENCFSKGDCVLYNYTFDLDALNKYMARTHGYVVGSMVANNYSWDVNINEIKSFTYNIDGQEYRSSYEYTTTCKNCEHTIEFKKSSEHTDDTKLPIILFF